ncbi:MAG TPA: TaqI-like C-terminal specificity domain-containing protein, partial [Acidobacteriota bacterium]
LGFNGQFVKLRKRILLESNVIALMYKAPFPKIVADTLIFVLQKGDRSKHDAVFISEYGRDAVEISQDDMLRDPAHRFQYFESAEVMRLIAKIESLKAGTVIKDLCDSTSGFGGKSALIQSTRSSERQIPALKGDSIGRYELKKQYWFDFRKENITGRTTDTRKLGCSPKILLRKTGDSIIATYDESGIFPEQSLYFLFNARNRVSLKFILGVLNSRLLTSYYRAKSLTNRESIAQVKKNDLDELPIPVMNLSNSHERAHHEKMVKLVEQMLVLHEQLVAARTGHEKNVLQRRIGATDQQIDQLVYELYSLTNEEIEIVEDVELVRCGAE